MKKLRNIFRMLECRWSKGKGTCPDCKGCRFKSCLALNLFLLINCSKRKLNLFDPQEMLEIEAICRSTSHWASPVVLVCKKDGSLRFCIDLRKLNNRTIKDAQSLLRIENSLDCFNGATIFTSLDLQSGYWQVELTEASRPLTAFTVGPLGFYECV